MFGQRLKKLREEKKLTQEELGKKLNLTKANISKYESGKLEPNIETIRYLADFFGVQTDYLLGISDNPSPASDDWGLPEDAHVFFKDYEKLSDEDKAKARDHVKYLLHMAEQKNKEK